MAYQVLARKWRPRSFETLVGQEHVVRALTHALSTGRLHHAYLFTGTRGVGKTTISRILAKSLNCETGVTATPCGECEACRAIDADRFPDYVEMDAASNRGVDDMAALLDKAVYAPVAGRYKVYMIDEVHMLTGHAFNAMLKTLEEPPEHVKFILATTDPQKIPVTVLSRCLQFNLKQMPQGHIVDHLARLLDAEGVPFEPAALRHLARGANGSMRDALSLLDQAIAHGAGKVEEGGVQDMLGTVGDDHLHELLQALAAGNASGLLAVADAMQARSLSFGAALQALASLLQRIALIQFAPGAVADEAERVALAPHAQAFDPEFLQLAYQIAIHGRDELPLAPDEYAGFTMTLLRLLAFRPDDGAGTGSPPAGGGGRAGLARPVPAIQPGSPSAPPSPAPPMLRVASAPEPRPAAVRPEVLAPVARAEAVEVPPWEDLPPEASPNAAVLPVARQPAVAPPAPAPSPAVITPIPTGGFPAAEWRALIQRLGLGGLVRELAQHCEVLSLQDGCLSLRLAEAHRHLLQMNRGALEKLQAELSDHFGQPLRVHVEVGEVLSETPAEQARAEKVARHAEAVAALEQDPFVQELIERFDATLLEESVKPL
ncbi:MAG: DNA polymerase III subunit gamma/tau [Rhodocyclaceae bacterium]|jgi:DNA polymerase-3 subunit gamma/tau|nr:DNA polymerase III subunit gamma/tau [Rhodocyclaceae bacterium]